MEIVNTAINATVIAAVALVLGWFAKGRFEAVQQQFQAVHRQIEAVQKQVERVDARVDDLQASFDAMRNQFQGSLDAMRSDLTQVALAVGARPRAENA